MFAEPNKYAYKASTSSATLLLVVLWMFAEPNKYAYMPINMPINLLEYLFIQSK